SSNPAECMKDSIIQIRGRGNATWIMDKKSYRIKFPQSTRILSMPAKDKSWVMLANYADKTLMRNAVAFEIGRWLGMQYTPPVRYADVFLNGEFFGNYMITDQLNVDKNRVNIEKLDSADTTLPAIAGGYLMEINGLLDATNDPFYVKTAKGLNVIVKYPDEDGINTQQFDYISRFVTNFENTLFSAAYKDPLTGYRNLVDTTEIINWYLACELTGNSDSFWSTYWYKKRSEDKIIFGPLWDFDIAFNNDNRLEDATQKLMRVAGFNPKAWVTQFASDPWFLKKTGQRFQEMKSAGLLDRLLYYIDSTATSIDMSQTHNFRRWDILDRVVYRELDARGTYQAEIDFLKNYLVARFGYLETALKYEELPVRTSSINPEYYYSIVNKKTGMAIDIQDASVQPSAKAVQYTYDKTRLSQQWEFIPTATPNVYAIQNRNSKMVLQNDGKISSQLIQDSYNSSSQYQQWKVVPVTPEYAGIQNVFTAQYSINNKGGSSADNNPVIEYTNNISGSDNQQWAFVKQGQVNPTEAPGVETGNNRIWVYSNPTKDEVNLFCHMDNAVRAKLAVYSVDGKCSYSRNDLAGDNGDFILQFTKSAAGLSTGAYIVKIEAGNGVVLVAKLLINSR
ncbi:MAG TPA: CotH kinase family protein, partial [Paludibacter sp.]|nr:CotH kinase family protein [Paludibacter sp.]